MTQEPPKPYIVCAALKHNDLILCGARHWDKLMHDTCIQLGVTVPTGDVFEQGFIDQWGNFHTREQAMQIVKDNGQPFDIERNGGSDDKLYSEGLY